ncbi:ketimine reductase mu-crystallin isoform X2 [Anthonomus grandis grandis]|nr:ketimine reductase mu-crystallin isoform X2 [Anthonomus grandis grandis]
MLTMSGYLEDPLYGAWVVKILTGNPNNALLPHPLPTLNANIVLFDQETGEIKALLDGTEITSWRTAAASAVATKVIHSAAAKSQKILSIFGCGEQGRAHAYCFYHLFTFDEIRLWNRTTQKAENFVRDLNKEFNTTKFKCIREKEDCARGADVIITTTNPGNEPIVKYQWLKKGVHINAVGVVGSGPEKTFELDEETYKNSQVFVDSWEGANKELTELKAIGTDLKAEVGEVILGKVSLPVKDKITVFQSLGMASEDCAMARMIYDLYCAKLKQ